MEWRAQKVAVERRREWWRDRMISPLVRLSGTTLLSVAAPVRIRAGGDVFAFEGRKCQCDP